MAHGIIGASNKPAVRGNMTPPRGAIPTGELYQGRTVYKELRRRFKRQLARDPDGEILYHTGPNGEKKRPMWELAEDTPEWIEYVIDDLGNGMTYRNTGFRPTQHELDAVRVSEVRNTNLDRLALALEQANLSVEDIVAVVKGLTETKQPEEETITDPDAIAERVRQDEIKAQQRERAASARAAKQKLEDGAP